MVEGRSEVIEQNLIIRQAESDEDIRLARKLFEEYQTGLDISLCFQNFDHELANLPGDYAPPTGRLLLSFIDDEPCGCIALRKIDASTCEMKRLFLRANARGQHLGRRLVEKIIDEAKQIGYAEMRLDTLPGKMETAIALYRSLGFKETAPYHDTPVHTIFMELKLV